MFFFVTCVGKISARFSKSVMESQRGKDEMEEAADTGKMVQTSGDRQLGLVVYPGFCKRPLLLVFKFLCLQQKTP